jgi:purine-binding chemotaxis protein CheW
MVEIENLQGTHQCLRFELGKEQYALPLEHVSSVIRWTEVTQLPNVDPHILGLANLRGRTMPVADLRIKLGLTSDVQPKDGFIVVCLTSKGHIGLLVDNVFEVMDVQTDELSNQMDSLSTSVSEYAEGVVNIDDRLITLLNLNMLVGVTV